MRIAIMGSGAVGGYFGAQLAVAGHELIFLARGPHLAALRRSGLRVNSPKRNLHVERAIFTDDAAEAGPVDLVLFCVKSYDTESAAKALPPLIHGHTSILSLQNGVDNPEKLAGLCSPGRILAGVVYIAAQLDAPGAIRHSSGGKIIFGRLDGVVDSNALLIEQTLSAAAIDCAISRDIQAVQWAKLLWNAPFCAISCLTGATTNEIADSDALTELALDCMREVQAAARTRNVDLTRDLFDETIAFSRRLGSFKPSMLQDLEARKPLEYEAFNGIVVRLLEPTGTPAPVNRAFYALVRQLDYNNRRETASPP
jgi:2-dehydropantoate 2-reductase